MLGLGGPKGRATIRRRGLLDPGLSDAEFRERVTQWSRRRATQASGRERRVWVIWLGLAAEYGYGDLTWLNVFYACGCCFEAPASLYPGNRNQLVILTVFVSESNT